MSSGLVELRMFLVFSVLLFPNFFSKRVVELMNYPAFSMFLNFFSKPYVDYVIGFGGLRMFLVCVVFVFQFLF